MGGFLNESEHCSAEFLAALGARQRLEEFLPAQPLHLAKGFLDAAPIGNGLLEPLVLFLGQGNTNGLAFDFAGPGITSATGSGSPILDIAFTDPAEAGQLRGEAGVFLLAGGRGGLYFWSWHEQKHNGPVNTRYIYLPMPKANAPSAPARPPTPKPSRQPRSYTPLSDALNQPLTFADTELAEGIQRHSLAGSLSAAISRKRRADGEPLPKVLCALLVWPLMNVKSIHCFCSELCQILAGQVSVLYDFLGREDINWRGLSSELARGVYHANDLGPRSQRAFVVDDTSQARAGLF